MNSNNNGVTITWTHTPSADSVPVTGFTLMGGPVGGPNEISRTVSPDVFSIVLQSEQLSPSTTYSISIVAESLLGQSEARSTQFVTLGECA